jgi:insulysin
MEGAIRIECSEDRILKSQNDSRSYRCIILENGLQVLLISDKDTDKAAAAMDVHVGHFSDPGDIPGLAHFLEHLLFMGTEKVNARLHWMAAPFLLFIPTRLLVSEGKRV